MVKEVVELPRQKYDLPFMAVEATTGLMGYVLDMMNIDNDEATYADLLYAFGIVTTVLYIGGEYDQRQS